MNSQIFIHFLKTEKELNLRMKSILEEVIKKHAVEACSLLGISYVNITVYSNPNFVIPETGEGGYAASGDWFQIYIDPTRPEKELLNIINIIIPATIYHELNHVARWNSTGYGSTLPEAIITEGIASDFANEKWKKVKSPWIKFSQKEIDSLLEIFQARNKKEDADYNHQEWFYGVGELPRWIGYKLGFYIISLARKNNPEISWKKLIKMDAKRLFKLAQVKI